MAYFKNKRTNITWHITDDAHIKRLKDDENYIDVSNSNSHESNEKTHSETINDSTNEETVKNSKIDNDVYYNTINWHELRKIASDKGINTKNKKRDEIEVELSELGAKNE